MHWSKIHRYGVVLVAALLMAACNSDMQVKVPGNIEDALYDRYPDSDIRALEWSLSDDGFFVAECRMDGYHCKVWFDASAHWYMTETSDLVYRSLPDDVREDFEERSGQREGEVRRVDFDYVESRYVVEGDRAYYFYRERDDNFIKRVDGAWENRPIVISDDMLRIVGEHFDAQVTTIVDADMEGSPLRLDLCEGGVQELTRYKTMYFDTPVMWLATVWRVWPNEVPSAVLEAVRAVVDDSRWQAVYRVEHQCMEHKCMERAYGFRLDNGTRLYFADDGRQETCMDEVPLSE